MADLSNPRSNDQSRSAGVPSFGSPAASETKSDRSVPGVGGADAGSQATPEAKRAGYGYSYCGENDHAMGGHNIDARNQYTVKPPRGSSL